MSFLTVIFFLWVSITAYAIPLLDKRGFNGQATYFAVGLGACGQYNVASDFIVALNTAQYGSGSPGPECFKKITITYNGKSVGATIMDECPTCGYGSLDLSQGLFEQFADTSVGEFSMTWVYDGAAPPAPSTHTTSEPAWTPKAKPTPTTTSTPTSTSTHHTTHSTTKSTTHTSHTTTTSSSFSTTTSSS
ncbi:hypothetical protein BS47DRAFT_1335511, partial [Hydnum rufescens UP504]